MANYGYCIAHDLDASSHKEKIQQLQQALWGDDILTYINPNEVDDLEKFNLRFFELYAVLQQSYHKDVKKMTVSEFEQCILLLKKNNKK